MKPPASNPSAPDSVDAPAPSPDATAVAEPAGAAAAPMTGGATPSVGAHPPTLAAMLGLAPLSALALLLGALALIVGLLLWQRLSAMQEPLARQLGESTLQVAEARTSAKAAQDLARETAARLAVAEVRLGEVALQRSQLEDLIQSVSRSRDDNLVVELEAALRLAQQQAQLTGSVEPLVAALRGAEQRVARAAQPGLAQVQRALARDISHITAAQFSDTPGLLARIDELLRQADELPLANAVAAVSAGGSLKRQEYEAAPHWWQRVMQVVGQEAGKLLRISRIEQPESALLSPEQSYFVRENFKLRLLNARLGLLARQLESARADLAAASTSLFRYFDATSRKTQAAAGLLQQLQLQMKTLELPRADESLAALATAAAGR